MLQQAKRTSATREAIARGRLRSAIRIPKGNHHTTLVRLFISLATAFIHSEIAERMEVVPWMVALCATVSNLGQQRAPEGRGQTGADSQIIEKMTQEGSLRILVDA
jgi:hypothetical protein